MEIIEIILEALLLTGIMLLIHEFILLPVIKGYNIRKILNTAIFNLRNFTEYKSKECVGWYDITEDEDKKHGLLYKLAVLKLNNYAFTILIAIDDSNYYLIYNGSGMIKLKNRKELNIIPLLNEPCFVSFISKIINDTTLYRGTDFKDAIKFFNDIINEGFGKYV